MHEPPFSRLAAYDILTCVYLAVIALLATWFADRVAQWWWYPLTHALVIGAILRLALTTPATASGYMQFMRWWYPAFLLPFIFRELEGLVHPINPLDVDIQLIALDLALFGVHPTVWLERITVPWLTEYLQLAYMTYFFLPLMIMTLLYRQRQWYAFRETLCALALSYYGSYLLYFLTPARGPRFYLAAEQTLPLTGLWLTEPLRQLLDVLEGIQRDAFPSGHTAVALVVLFLAAKYHPPWFYPLLVIVSSLIVSTVYLRYHYVIDVLAGVLLAGCCLGATAWLYGVRKARVATQPATPKHGSWRIEV